jgi:predicted ATPase/DNA-binding SARP family transcriptional activator
VGIHNANADALWRIEMLGGLRAVQGDCVLTRFRSQKTGALLAYLAYYPHRSHPRDLLIDLLWPEDPLDSARMKLRTALASLRRQLEPPGIPASAVIVATRLAVRLNPEAVITDVAQFEAALQAAGDASRLDEQLAQLDAGIAWYRGPLLLGYYESWILPEQQRLSGLCYQALRRAVDSLEQAGDLDRALAYAIRAVATEPLWEEGHQELIRLYRSTGQPAAALRQYRELEALLREEVGEAPSAATRELVEGRSASHRPAGTARPLIARCPLPDKGNEPLAKTDQGSSPAAPRSVSRPLPLPLTRFFGREAEIARVRRLLIAEGTRLVTLTGPGGSGKTRLALETAARLREAMDGAVWFVPLADLADPHRIIDAIHAALGLPRLPQQEPREQIVDALAARPSLLVLDNLEHLLPAAGPVVRGLLEEIPLLHCLVTTRQILELEPEREIVVGPLPVPGVQAFRPGTRAAGDGVHVVGRAKSETELSPSVLNTLLTNESVALFVDRAQRAMPDFQLAPANAPAVAELCRRLEGIPLAIELAAARVQRRSPARMLAELEQRFDLLVSRRRDLPSRHQTLRAAIDWSYQILSPKLQRFFVALFVFRGRFTAEAAAAVSEESRASLYLKRLQAASLVWMDDAGSEPRYRLLEMLREYAIEELLPEKRAEVAGRHAHHFLALAEAAEPAVRRGLVGSPGAKTLEAEHDNLRAALDWAVRSDAAEVGLRLAAALGSFWDARGYLAEGRERSTAVLALAGAAALPELRMRVLESAGGLGARQGDYDAEQAFFEEHQAIAEGRGEPREIARSQFLLGGLADDRGDDEAAWAFYSRSLSLVREMGDAEPIPAHLNNLGYVARRLGRAEVARPLLEESLALYRERGSLWGAATATANLGNLARTQGDFAQARTLLEESLAIGHQLGNQQIIGNLLVSLGMVAHKEGDYPGARALYQQSLVIRRETDDWAGVADCLEGLALVSWREKVGPDGLRAAARLMGAASALHELTHAIRMEPDIRLEIEQLLAAVHATHGDEAVAAAWDEGGTMSIEQAADWTLRDAEIS